MFAKMEAHQDGTYVTRKMWHHMTFNASRTIEVGVSTIHSFSLSILEQEGTPVVSFVRSFLENIETYKYVTN